MHLIKQRKQRLINKNNAMENQKKNITNIQGQQPSINGVAATYTVQAVLFCHLIRNSNTLMVNNF